MNVKTLCLGYLSLHEATGYEIKKDVEDGLFSHFIEASYGSIYPALNQLANEGATAIKLPPVDTSKINQADLMDRLAGEVSKINRSLAVDRSELTAQAGSRLKQRYVQITRRSEMLTPTLPQTAEGEAKVLMFPA